MEELSLWRIVADLSLERGAEQVATERVGVKIISLYFFSYQRCCEFELDFDGNGNLPKNEVCKATSSLSLMLV